MVVIVPEQETKNEAEKDQEEVDDFLRHVRDFDHRKEGDHGGDVNVDELHHRSKLGEGLKFGGGISAKQYTQYMMEMDPTIAIKYRHYTRCLPCWCTWSPCCSSFPCTRTPCCPPHYCTPHCGVPKPCIYWFLNMFISAIALTLEMDFIGLAYNWMNGAFHSENQIIVMVCIWATVAYSLTNLVLMSTIQNCAQFTRENVTSKPEDRTCLAVCPVMNVGSVDGDLGYPSSVERFFSIRIRWWMVVPCCRLIFVLAVNGNADAALATKSMSKMREEKTTNFRSMAIMGMLNTFTVTVPNMVMGYFSLQDSGGFEDGNVMDSIFFFTSCFSFVLTMISMCYGVLDAVVHTIDFMDKLLNDVQELEEHQHKCIKFAKWHLDELADVIHYIHMVLYALKKESTQLFRPRSKALLRAIKKHIPEDKEMLRFKNWLMKKIDPEVKEDDAGGANVDYKAPKMDESEMQEWNDLVLEYYGLIDCWMHQYLSDLTKSCVITKMDHNLILEKYMPILLKREKAERQQMLDTNSYFYRDEDQTAIETEKIELIYKPES